MTSARERSEPGRVLEGIRVLFVEDDEYVREVLGMILEEQGAAVTAVGSAGEALEALRREAHDVVVSDLGMPGEDGYALIRKIRALPDRHGAMPAVALTGYVRRGDRTRALSEGYQAHFTKPVDPDELAATIQRLVRRDG